MKRTMLGALAVLVGSAALAQTYPEPEFSNEIYLLKKNPAYSLVRLERESSNMETKTKLGGLGGAQSGYTIAGPRSSVRFAGGDKLSFVFTRSASTSSAGQPDPSAISGALAQMNDPANMISLYKVESGNGNRMILLQRGGGALPFGRRRQQSSEKYTFGVKKIREGYWELALDKPLPKGEYAFTMMNVMNMSLRGGTVVFAFGVD